jgi:hypothetical protein
MRWESMRLTCSGPLGEVGGIDHHVGAGFVCCMYGVGCGM